MTEQELQVRIEKKKSDIAKIEKRIAKWSKGLRPEDIAVCEPFGNCVYGTAPRSMSWRDYHGTPAYQEANKKYYDYVDTHKDIPQSDDWNKGPSISELRNAYRDLGEAKATLDKYLAEVDKINNFQKMDKIKPIWDFLQDWRSSVREYVIENAKEYYKLQQDEDKAFKEYLAKNNQDYNEMGWNARWTWEKMFKRQYYIDIHSITRSVYTRRGEVDIDKLDKYLDRDVKAKYDNLVNRITEDSGEILDASGLYIANNGEINGYVVGTKGKVKVETITAGGYAIQIRHYRVLVHKVK